MLTVFIEKEFIDDLEGRKDLDHDVVRDFLFEFLKKVRNVKVYIDLKGPQELWELSEKSRYWNYITEWTKIEFTAWINNLEECFHVRSFSKLFLVRNGFPEKEYERRTGNVFISNSSLIEKWEPLMLKPDVSEYFVGSDIENQYCFHSWDVLLRYKHVFSRAILIDLYILSNKKNQRLADNLDPLLGTLAKFHEYRKIKLTVVTSATDPGKEQCLLDDEVAAEMKDCKNFLDSFEEFESGLVHYKKFGLRGDHLRLHDRKIITPYLLFECGAGWNIFKENGRPFNQTSVSVKSIFKNDVRSAAIAALDQLKEYFSAVKYRHTRFFKDSNESLKANRLYVLPSSMELDF